MSEMSFASCPRNCEPTDSVTIDEPRRLPLVERAAPPAGADSERVPPLGLAPPPKREHNAATADGEAKSARGSGLVELARSSTASGMSLSAFFGGRSAA